MSLVGTIIVSLQAQNADLKKKLEESSSAIESLKSASERAASAVESLLEVAGIAISIEGIKSMIEDTIEATTKTVRLSEALGISTQSLQGLDFAAKKAGISSEEVGTALEKMTKNIGAAEQGSKAQTEAFDRLGLSAKNLAGQKIDTTFEQIADKISALPTVTDRVKASVDIFGKSGANLLPLFLEGSQGIEKAKQEAIDLGLAMSDADSSKLVEAHIALENLEDKIEGIVNQIAIGLVPAIDHITASLDAMIPSADHAKNSAVTLGDVLIFIVDVVEDFVSAAGTLVGVISDVLILDFTEFGDAVLFAGEALAQVGRLLGIPGSKAFLNDIKETKLELDDFAHRYNQDVIASLHEPLPSSQVDGAMAKLKQEEQDAADAAKKLHDGLAGIDDGSSEKVDKVAESIKRIHDEINTIGDTKEEKALYDLAQDGATFAQITEARRLLDILGQQEKQIKDIAQATKDKQKAADDAAEKMKQEAEEAKRLTESVTTPFEKYNQQLLEYKKLQNDKLIDLATFTRLAQKAQEDFNNAIAKGTDLATKEKDKPINSNDAAGAAQSIHDGQFAPANQEIRTQTQIAQKQLDNSNQQSFWISELYRIVRDGFSSSSDTVLSW